MATQWYYGSDGVEYPIEVDDLPPVDQVDDCRHPAERLWCWFAYDGTLCVCCTACGLVVAGGADDDQT